MSGGDSSYVSVDRFNDHITKCDHIQDSLEATNRNLEDFKATTADRLDQKIGKDQFYWFMGISFTILSAILGLIYKQNLDIKNETTNVQVHFAEMVGQLKQLEILK